jgi:formylmethanofuran--tetrahydromethanopterin N-formyltransferase
MKLNGVEIEDTYAEAFTGFYSRILITAVNEKWARIAATEAVGYGTSLIECSAETGIEGMLPSESTPDGRPGCVIQIWASKKKMTKELIGRIGQCILTSPTAAVFNYCDSDEKLDVGYKMRFFGDGYESTTSVGGREMVSIPIMMGDFLIEKELGIAKGVAGGNFIILAKDQKSALRAAEEAVCVIEGVEGVITPFPGGVCAAGSKVGSKYKFMIASTNDKYCPTIADKVKDSKVKGIGAVLEIVIDGISEEKVGEAMKQGIKAAAEVDGVKKITAGNYGGTLGKVHFHLRKLLE